MTTNPALHHRHSRYQHDKIHNLDYPANIIDTIFEDPNYHINHDITSEQQTAVDHILQTVLTDREREIIQMRYQEHLSLRKSAERQNCTGERIRQIEQKALHKLQRPTNKNMITMGYHAFHAQDIHALRMQRQDLLTMDIRTVQSQAFMEPHRGNVRISNKNMTVVYNNGIKTVGDLLLYERDEIRSMLPDDLATSVIILRTLCDNELGRQNLTIIQTEQCLGIFRDPTTPYPANLFDAIYGINRIYKTGGAPSDNQIAGINWLIQNKLPNFQQKIITLYYEQQMSIPECGRSIGVKRDTIKQCLRDILHILREQPDCIAYIQGHIQMQPISNEIMGFSSNTPAHDLYLPDNITDELSRNGIKTIHDIMLTQPLVLSTHLGCGETWVRTHKYLTELNIANNDQISYLKSIRLDTVPLTDAERNILRTADITTANDALISRCDKIPIHIQDKIRITICLRATKLHHMNLSTRAHNGLRRAGINSAETIANMSDEELYRLKNIGPDSVENIRTAVNEVLAKINNTIATDSD